MESHRLYKIRLTSSLECVRYLIAQGLSFRGHDESTTSLNKGNFLEMIDWLKDSNEEVRDAFDRGGENCKMTSGEIQKDLARCCAEEVTKVIMAELGDKKFSVLIDESRDISVKEQMAVMLRLVTIFYFLGSLFTSILRSSMIYLFILIFCRYVIRLQRIYNF